MDYEADATRDTVSHRMTGLLQTYYPEIESIRGLLGFYPTDPSELSAEFRPGTGYTLTDEVLQPADKAWLEDLRSRRENGHISETDLLREVNVAVNRATSYTDDQVSSGQREYVATARETYLQGIGDCEDFAGLKAALLKRLGYTDDQMVILSGTHPITQETHSTLVIRSGAQLYTLDNNENDVTRDPTAFIAAPSACFSPSFSTICMIDPLQSHERGR